MLIVKKLLKFQSEKSLASERTSTQDDVLHKKQNIVKIYKCPAVLPRFYGWHLFHPGRNLLVFCLGK